ncbi:MAG TPA: hypothetical protein EYG32_07250, partial [Acidimicrobiia bacterium]|nr:hypothetical protein [Acidimicrobiia bacterium]
MTTTPTTEVLSADQLDRYHANGYLLLEDAVPSDVLGRLRETFAVWTEESRAHDAPYGETIDG